MPLPDFPKGINTELRPTPKPIPFKRPVRKKPRDPRNTFLIAFFVVMLVIVLYPTLQRLFLVR